MDLRDAARAAYIYTLPLIEIAPPDAEADQATLRHWRAHWTQADAILFVSGAAVTHFFESGVAPARQPPRTRFWAPGPGTARLLAQAGAALDLLENDRYDAVTIAAVADDEDTLRLLLQLGASAQRVTSRYDGTALIAAAHLGHAEVGDGRADRRVVHGDADHQAEREEAVDDALAELGCLYGIGSALAQPMPKR